MVCAARWVSRGDDGRETIYFVHAFEAGRSGNLKADAPIARRTEAGALRTAERLLLSKCIEGDDRFQPQTFSSEASDVCFWGTRSGRLTSMARALLSISEEQPVVRF